MKPRGCVRYRQWDWSSERGVARQPVAVWVAALSAAVTTLTIEHAEEPLAQYTATPEPDRTHRKDVAPLRLVETRFASPQPMVWEPNAVEWRLALPRQAPTRRRRTVNGVIQSSFFPEIAI